mmetsp:Transcript_85122/g.237531  ORF Transcript_85122/g.237531 Transcript_85122/m.237531 type:complete len:426 (+) Transcript_85122:179-1456(+)
MLEVSYDVPMDLPDAGILSVSAQQIAAMPDASEREDAITTIFKLIDGVLSTPEEAKKRRVRKSNEVFHRKVGRHAAAVEFLRGVGFVVGDDAELGEEGRGGLFTMPVAYMSRLTDAHHTLANAARQVGLIPPPVPTPGGAVFNPYQSNRQSMDGTRTAKAPDTWKTEADRVREEVKRREVENKRKIDAAPPVDMNPSAFWLSAGRRLEEVIREGTNPSEDRAADNNLLSAQVASAKAAIAGSETFQSADKKRLEDLSRKRVHERCVLRIICPDKSVLQATFRSGDTGAHVVERLKPLLAPHIREASWYFYQSPPMQRLAPRATLASAGLTPGANMYLGFDGAKPAGPYLDEPFVAQMGPPPQGERGVTQAGGFDVGTTFSGEAMGWGVGKKLGGTAPNSSNSGAGAPSIAAASPPETAPAPMQEG